MLLESFEPGELVSKYTLQKALGMEGGDALRKDLAHFVVALSDLQMLGLCQASKRPRGTVEKRVFG